MKKQSLQEIDNIVSLMERMENISENSLARKEILEEHINDLKPIICIIIGMPGVGKTTWMHNKANSFLNQQFRKLDIDHTQQEFQLQTCNEVAIELVTSLCDFPDAMFHTKRNFESIKQNIQNRINSEVDRVGSKGMYIDIMNIRLDSKIGKRTLWEWAKNLSKIEKEEKIEEALKHFQSDFYATFFREIFSSDFSKRDLASKKYDQIVKTKLSGQKNDVIDYNNDSICIATLGKSVDDVNWYINQVEHTDSVICLVYLDAPIALALEQNKKRGRQVSEDLIRETFSKIGNTWSSIKNDLDNTKIWRIFRLVPNTKTLSYSVVENIPNSSMLNTKNHIR